MTEQLIQHEDTVLSIVEEYLNANRFFTLDDIVPYIHVRIKKTTELNQAGIREILKSLIAQQKIVERSKLTYDSVLENENRSLVFRYIKDNPGIYFNQLAKNLNMSNYILAWHLKMLLQFGYIRNNVFENHEVFYESSVNPENDKVLYIVSKEKSKDIIHFLLQNPEGVSKTRVSKELRMHSSTVSAYLKTLEQVGAINCKKLSKKTIFFVNEKYYFSILNM